MPMKHTIYKGFKLGYYWVGIIKQMKTLLKWPGGKARELKFILPHIPDSIENYYEPFLGGGAVYFNLNTVKKSCYVNDMSDELINFYLSIKEMLFSYEKSNTFFTMRELSL